MCYIGGEDIGEKNLMGKTHAEATHIITNQL